MCEVEGGQSVKGVRKELVVVSQVPLGQGLPFEACLHNCAPFTARRRETAFRLRGTPS
jgi:hypothetical protein